jgi:hypothetical protein
MGSENWDLRASLTNDQINAVLLKQKISLNSEHEVAFRRGERSIRVRGPCKCGIAESDCLRVGYSISRHKVFAFLFRKRVEEFRLSRGQYNEPTRSRSMTYVFQKVVNTVEGYFGSHSIVERPENDTHLFAQHVEDSHGTVYD